MRKNSILIKVQMSCAILFYSLSMTAQTSTLYEEWNNVEYPFQSTTTTLYTPKGTATTGFYRTEGWTSAVKLEIKNYCVSHYPQATFMSEATTTYNCHAYAFYMRQGGETCWINTPAAFINDGSYYETTSILGDLVTYAGSSGMVQHSSIKSAYYSGKYESKWGNWCLMRHPIGHCPYSTSTLKYYKKTPHVIEGYSIIGGTENRLYKVSYVPQGQDVTWVWNTSLLSKVSSTDSTIILKPKTSTSVGDGYVQARFYETSTNTLKKTLSYNIGVGGAHTSNVGLRVVRSSDGVEVYPSSVGLCPNTYYYAYISGTAGATLTWSPTHATVISSSNSYMYFYTDSYGYSLLDVYGVLSQYGVSKKLVGVTLYGGSSCN
ncbi:MAG: hypothetical protein IJL37_02480 [Bacteroidaceae bacterium]|nr:hypothetical protein [Bacteroidaceae bacterium]